MYETLSIHQHLLCYAEFKCLYPQLQSTVNTSSVFPLLMWERVFSATWHLPRNQHFSYTSKNTPSPLKLKPPLFIFSVTGIQYYFNIILNTG